MEILRDIKTKKILAIGGSVPEARDGQEVIKTKIGMIPEDFINEDFMMVYRHDEEKDVLVKMTQEEIESSDDYKKVLGRKEAEEAEKKIQDKIREIAIKELEKDGEISQSAASAEGEK